MPEEITSFNKRINKEICNWILGDVSRIMNANNIDITSFSETVPPRNLFQLVLLVDQNVISNSIAKKVLEEMFLTGKSAGEIIKKQGLKQINDPQQLEIIIDIVIKADAGPVSDFKAGKKGAFKFLVGQIMKVTKGSANPTLVSEILNKKLVDS